MWISTDSKGQTQTHVHESEPVFRSKSSIKHECTQVKMVGNWKILDEECNADLERDPSWLL